MVSLPNHIADRIRQIIDAGAGGTTIDDAARDYGAIALMGTIGSLWMMRPDGTLWDVDLDWDKPFAPLPDELHITALVAGAERFPWLKELVPERPATARDCPVCNGGGLLFPKEFVSQGS